MGGSVLSDNQHPRDHACCYGAGNVEKRLQGLRPNLSDLPSEAATEDHHCSSLVQSGTAARDCRRQSIVPTKTGA